MSKIKVYCRLKPSLIQKTSEAYEIKKSKEHEVLSFKCNIPETFRFQKVFDEKTTQKSVFDHVAVPQLDQFISGMNSTIYTYGQTGSGKTHTIYGSKYDKGIIPRSFEYIFNNSQSTEELVLSISYIEIYNEEVYDLLSKSVHNFNVVKYFVKKTGKIVFKNLIAVKVKNVSEALQLLKSGNAKRKISPTLMNKQSSRSHCICKITSSNNKYETVLNLVDLAGSERISKENDDKILCESRYINKSLFYLHQVILVLASNIRQKHVPYRNSTLTLMLKDTLSYNGSSAMISTINLNKRCLEESLSTCRYSKDVMRIKMMSFKRPSKDNRNIKCHCSSCPLLHSNLYSKTVNSPDGRLTLIGPALLIEPGMVIRNHQKYDFNSDNVARAVGHDKQAKRCETMAAVVSSSSPVVEDKPLMHCCGVSSDSRRCRRRVTSVYHHWKRILPISIIMNIILLFTLLITCKLEVSAEKLYSATETIIIKQPKPDLLTMPVGPEWKPPHQDPVRPSGDCCNLKCRCSGCAHHSSLYSKTVRQNV